MYQWWWCTLHTQSIRIDWLAALKKVSVHLQSTVLTEHGCSNLRIGALLTWRALESSLPLKTPQVCDQPKLSWNPLLSSRNHPPRWADHPNLARDSRPKYAPYPYFSELPSNTNSVFPCILWVTLKYNGEDELSGIFCYPNKPTPVDSIHWIPQIVVTITFMTSSGRTLKFNSLVKSKSAME